tara:strand:- start:36 stop:788 length:753 start_codon:yes stop_codon:yes gene_type:complete
MSYRPKSKYQKLETSGDEWKIRGGGQPYTGPYLLTSDGAFTGNDITNIGQRLVKINSTTSTPPINNIRESLKVNEYYRLNPNLVNFIQQTNPIISTKTFPTKKDYEKGSYVRYFAKKVNSPSEYYEIDLKTYKSINAKNPQFDFYSFKVGKLMWALEGDVIKSNKSILSQNEVRYPNISYLFQNLSEFVKPKTKTKNINLSKIHTKVQLTGDYTPPIEIKSKLKDLENNQTIKKTTPTGGSTSGGGGGGY